MALPTYQGKTLDDLLASWGGDKHKALAALDANRASLPAGVYTAWHNALSGQASQAQPSSNNNPHLSLLGELRLGAGKLVGEARKLASGAGHAVENFGEVISKPLYAGTGAANAIENLQNPVTGALHSMFPRLGHPEDRKTMADVIFNPEGRQIEAQLINRLTGKPSVPVPSGQPTLPERVVGFGADIAYDPLGALGHVAQEAAVVPRTTKAISKGLMKTPGGQRFLDLFSTRAHLENPLGITPNLTAAQQEEVIKQPLTRESGTSIYERRRDYNRRKAQIEDVSPSLQNAEDLLNTAKANSDAYRRYLRSKTVEEAQGFLDRIKGVEKEGISRQQLFDAIERGAKQPKLVEALTPDARRLRDDIINANQERLAREIAAGVPVRGLNDVLEYMTHLVTPEARDILRRQTAFRPGDAVNWTLRNKFQLERDFKGMSAAQINAYVAKHGLNVDGHTVKIPQLFEEDPVKAYLARGYAGASSEANARFLDDAVRLFGRPITDKRAVERGYREIKPDDAGQYGNLIKDVVFPPEIAAQLTKALQPKQIDAARHGIIRAYNRSWKVGTLAFRPSYHFRNIVGNMWNNWIAGVDDPNTYVKAADVMKGKDGTIKVGKRTLTYDQLRQLLAERGVTHQGFYGAEIEKLLEPAVEGKVRKALGPAAKATGAAADKSFAAQRIYEDWTRVAHVLAKLKQGDTLDEAVNSMRRTLFDYHDLTDFERNTARLLVPFYTWTRKNLPYQLESLIENPQKLSAPAKAQTETERGRSIVSPQIRPDFVAGAGNAVEFAPGKFTRLQGTIPSQDISEASNPAQFITQLLHPAFNVAADIARGANVFGSDVRSDRVKANQAIPLTDVESDVLGMIPGANAAQDVIKAAVQPGIARKLLSYFTGQRVYDINPREELSYDANALQKRARQEVYARNRLPKGSAARARQEEILQQTIAKLRGLQRVAQTLPKP